MEEGASVGSVPMIVTMSATPHWEEGGMSIGRWGTRSLPPWREEGHQLQAS